MASTDAGLPEGWNIKISSSKGHPYYFYPPTGESSWEPPEGTNMDKLQAYLANLQPANSNSGKVRAAHLLVKHSGSRRPASWRSNNITRSKDEAREILQGYEQRIKSGETSLQDLAQSESDCSSAKKGGDLGFFGRREMQQEFEQVAFALNPGEMSGIVETASGLHLIQRLE